MSLLMDALRKAEEAKRKTSAGIQEDESATESSAASQNKETSPLETSSETPPPSPEKSLDDVQEYFDHKNRVSRKRNDANREALQKPVNLPDKNNKEQTQTSPSEGYDRFQDSRKTRESAAAVFTAKQGSEARNSKHRLMFIAMILIPVLGTSIWFYLAYTEANTTIISDLTASQNQRFLGENLIDEPRQLPPSEITVTNPLLDTPPVLTIPTELEPESEVLASTEPPETFSMTIGGEPPLVEAENSINTFALEQNTVPVTSSVDARQEPKQSNELQLTRNTPPIQQTLTVQEAYNHLQLGNFNKARQLYQSVLANSPNNRDAMLGMATLFSLEGDTIYAQRLYARLLQLNPRDPLASAGLIETTLASEASAAAEQELLSLISGYTTTAPLYFALGNLYASQKRWSEAQYAYFDALAYAQAENPDSLSPDYAFNLAISLEQINKPSLAYEYYKQAEAAARTSSASFDPAVLSQRLRFLEQQLP